MIDKESVSANPLISSDRVDGTAVYDRAGKHIGSIDTLMIDKVSGQVKYAVVTFGGFLTLGQESFPLPWDKFEYDTSLGGYRADVSEEQLHGSPAEIRSSGHDWSDPARTSNIDDYWMRRWGV
jgi:hypothetical protein